MVIKFLKKLLVVITISLLPLLSLSQSGWSSGQYYAYQGSAVEQCGYSYAKYDYWGNFIGYYKTCRILIWERKYYTGYIYYWGMDGWYAQWQEGYSWYCYWGPYYEKYSY